MSLSILIPTTGRRDHLLIECVKAYADEHPDAQLIITDRYSWGEGCNQLAAEATGDHWLLACDDIVPVAGWYDAALEMLETGVVPMSHYWTPEGEPLNPKYDGLAHGTPVDWTRTFFLTPGLYREIGPLLDATWYTDLDYSERLIAAGWPIQACDGFSFLHLHGERDWATEAELAVQFERWQEARAARMAA